MVLLALVLAVAPDCWSFGYGREPKCDVVGQLQVAKRVRGKGARVYELDLDSDGRLDRIVETTLRSGRLKTCFVTSGGEERACRETAPAAELFSLHWFAQLDADPMLELFEMTGGEDHSHYSVRKLDPLTWQPTKLFELAPLLRTAKTEPKETYWGYPWDVRDLSLRTEGGRVELLTAEASCIRVDDEGGKRMPVVFFTGTPTQGEPSTAFVKAVKAARWRTLAELVELAKSPLAKCP